MSYIKKSNLLPKYGFELIYLLSYYDLLVF